MKDALRILGYAGTVLLLFGLLSFAFSGTFDLWTAVHVAGAPRVAVAEYDQEYLPGSALGGSNESPNRA